MYDLVAHPTQNLVYSAGPDTLILVWDALSSKPVDTLKGHKHWIWKLRFAQDPNYLYAAAGETELVRWNLEKGKIDLRFHGHIAGIFDVDVHPNGTFLASASWDGTVRIWNPLTGNEVQLLTPRQPMQTVLWSPDGKYLVLGDYPGNLYIYQTQGWKKIHQFQAHAGGRSKNGFPELFRRQASIAQRRRRWTLKVLGLLRLDPLIFSQSTNYTFEIGSLGCRFLKRWNRSA